MRRLWKHRWIWFLAALLPLVVLAGYVLIPVGARISQANCDKIQLGWTLAQVEELLGGYEVSIDGEDLFWSDEDGNAIFVHFEPGRGATEMRFVPDDLTSQERIKRRTRKRIREVFGIPPEP